MLGNRLLFYVKPTEQCNTQCLHCYNSVRPQSLLDVTQYRKFMDSVATQIETRPVEIVFHGGEPTLVGSERIEQYIKETRAALSFADLKFSIQTNLLNCDLGLFELVHRYMGGILGTSYSPYIRFNDPHDYDRWLENLRRAVGNAIMPYLIITLSKKYIENTKPIDLLDFLITENIWGFHFEPLTNDGFATDNWNEIKPDHMAYDLWKADFANLFISHRSYRTITKSDIVGKSRTFIDGSFTGCCTRGCYTGVFTINSNGTVGGCPNKSHAEIFGNIRDSFERIVDSPVRKQLMIKERIRRDECLSCDMFSYCNGGCVQTNECMEGRYFYRLLADKFAMDGDFKKFVTESAEERACV